MIHKVRSVLNSPYILALAPLLVGGFFLVLHPDIITNNLNKPYALAIVPCAVASILVGWLIFTFFKTIAAWCHTAFQAVLQARKADSSGQFFWGVVLVFMLVSVLEAGPFFDIIEHGAMFGLLGFVTVFAIDLIAIQCMRARLEAVRVRDQWGARLYLFGVIICAGLSAFANTFSSLSGYTQTVTGMLPPWMNTAAPWFGLAFPLLILFLSLTADYTVDRTNTRLDAEEYRKQEQKRLEVLLVRREMQQKMLDVEADLVRMARELKTIRQKRDKKEREFFLVRWLFPLKQPDMRQVLAKVAEQREQHKAEDREHIMREIEAMRRELAEQQKREVSRVAEQFEATLAQMQERVIHDVLSAVQKQPVQATHPVQEQGQQGGTSNASEGASPPAGGSTRRTKRRGSRSAGKKRASAYDLVFAALSENPHLTVTELSFRTRLAKGTVSPLRTRILGEFAERNEQSVVFHEGPDTGEIERHHPQSALA